MDWRDEEQEPGTDEIEVATPPLDAANVSLQLTGLLLIAVGAVLMVPPTPGVATAVDSGSNSAQALGAVCVGGALLLGAGLRRRRRVLGLVLAVPCLFASVAQLFLLGAGLLVVVPVAVLLALVNRPLPRPAAD